MAEYSIIADLSNYLLEGLRKRLSPALFTSSYQIGMTSPDAENADYLVGLYLYDVQEEREIARPSMIGAGNRQQRKSPACYRLSYMVYLNEGVQTGIHPADGQRVMGRIMQILNDMAIIPMKEIQPANREEEPDILLNGVKLELEEKMRIWQAISKPYRLSLFYQAHPVFLSSEYVEEVYPVLAKDITVSSH